jgi:hypothetical protein
VAGLVGIECKKIRMSHRVILDQQAAARPREMGLLGSPVSRTACLRASGRRLAGRV